MTRAHRLLVGLSGLVLTAAGAVFAGCGAAPPADRAVSANRPRRPTS